MIGADLRYSFRTLAKQRGFTAVAVLTLAIALAANTAIFSVVNAILLRPLPFAAPERLVNLTGINRIGGGSYPVYSHPNYRDVRTQSKTLEQVVAFTRGRAFLMEGDEPELLPGLNVTHNLPELLGVRPQLGRFFSAAEDRAGAPKVVVISHSLWQRKFNGDRAIIGRALRIGTAGDVYTVVGVMPPKFRFPVDEVERDYYSSFEEGLDEQARTTRDQIFISVAGKMRPGVSLEQARAELDTLSRRLEKQYPEANAGVGFVASSMHEDIVRDIRPALLMLFGAVAVVLLIGCANVANLLLARATSRHKEISIRAAIGASPWRITVQLLVESVVLSLLAGACGLLLASWGIDALLAFAPGEIPRLDTISLDGRVLLFTTVLSIFTGIAFGLAPAISASRPNLTEALKEGTRGSTEGKRNRLRSVLVVSAVAMSLMLLAGAGLLLRSFIHVTGIDAGYDHRSAIALDISPRALAYPEDAQIHAFYDRLFERLRALPGVQSVAAVDALPLTPNESVWSFSIVGRPPAPPGRGPSAKTVVVTPGFFQTMRIPLHRGRDIAETDRANAPAVTVVNQAFVRELFPNENPVGKKIALDRADGTQELIEIVGVVGDVRWRSLTDDVRSTMFMPFAQRSSRFLSVVIRAPGAESLGPTLRGVVRQVDRQQPIINIGTLAVTRSESLATRRFNMILLAVLAVVALVLAAVGIFSVMSYAVTQRTTEIGIRMALGAEQRDVFQLIVGHAARLVVIGAVIGVVGALLSSRAIGTLMYGVKPTDPWTFAAIVVVIAGTALLASYLPARRAAKVDPLVAIRYD
ncbi:MAG TPA: ABC transporter permease [Thermoanaerobaculia bacterium]|nr:ABC transporter permease [Thermoanaerobaculia bacterium]